MYVGILQRRYPRPSWTGDPAVGNVLLWGERGIGDEIRYASMILDALRAVESVTVECASRLVGLFHRSFPATRMKPGPYKVSESYGLNFTAMSSMGVVHLTATAANFYEARIR